MYDVVGEIRGGEHKPPPARASKRRGEDLLLELREMLDEPPSRLTATRVERLPRLYRFASTELAKLQTGSHDHERLADLQQLVARAHQLLYGRAREGDSNLLRRAVRHFMVESPRAVRAEWRLLLGLFVVFYALAGAAYLGVRSDLELAYALQGAGAVDAEIEQLRALAPGEDFRGNFTFGMEQSGSASGMILANNIRVSLLFFVSGLIPPLFLLVLAGNALMLGTYLGVASHWNQTAEISSILWCHGTIELQMILLGGAAGLVLARAWLSPGPWSRSHAMALESKRAWALAAPTVPWLFFSGLIEGYVSPHAGLSVRLLTAVFSGLLLLLWALSGLRERDGSGRPSAA